MPTLSRRTKQDEYSSPKTVLGFYAGVLALIELGVVGAIGVLATQQSLRYLVAWVLGFGGILLVGLIGIVVTMNVRDPSKLQLGEMTGREFIEYQRMTLGDSVAGEFTEEVPIVRGTLRPVRPEPRRPLLEPSDEQEET